MPKTLKRYRIKTGFSLLLFLVLFSLPAHRLLAADSLLVSADRSRVEAGEAVTVSVELKGSAIWAYQIDLRSNEMFSGGETFLEDHDGSGSVTVSSVFYAMAPGNGKIYAKASYSDGDRLLTLKEEVLSVTVEEAEEAGRQREGTGGQAGAGTFINGEPAPEEPRAREDTPDVKEEIQEETTEKKQTEKEPAAAQEEAATEKETQDKKTAGFPVWIAVCVIAAVLLAGGGVLLVLRKKKKQDK